MVAKILDGKAVAATIRRETAEQVRQWTESGGRRPCLAAILVGENPASEVYVRNKQRACEQAVMTSRLLRLSGNTSTEQLLEEIRQLNDDASVHGILCQLPLPSQIEELQILDAISPSKDVDAFCPENVGLLVQGRARFLPCTPHGVIQLLAREMLSTNGKRAVVIGRSDIVGKPLSLLLGGRDGPCGPEFANATVTMAHSRTPQLDELIRECDIVVAAVGRAELVRGEWLKPGAIAIDVGINRVGDRLVGDLHFKSCMQTASAITPVPGGIGPLTIAMLLENTLKAARLLG